MIQLCKLYVPYRPMISLFLLWIMAPEGFLFRQKSPGEAQKTLQMETHHCFAALSVGSRGRTLQHGGSTVGEDMFFKNG